MAYRATDHLILGRHGEIAPGQDVPESYVDSLGDEQPTDFDRLEELGIVEKSAPRQKRSPAKRES